MLLEMFALLLATTGQASAPPPAPVVSVANGSTADFATVQAAIDHAPPQGETILIAPGSYRDKLHVLTPNIHLIGAGKRPGDVVLSWNDAAVNAGGTGKSGTLTVNADGFEAENLTIQNTWEKEHQRTEEGSQAVALLLSSDRAVLDHVRLLGAQDTLYANSRTCRDLTMTAPCNASRELFNDCYIEGHVDFIFGDALAVFNHCELHTLHHPEVMLTAQSKHFGEENSGYYFLHCRVTGDDQGEQVYLGRPWRDYSTVLFYDTEINRPLNAAGWREWSDRLKTSTYREYKSHGSGVNGGHRIITEPPLTKHLEHSWTPQHLLAGSDDWQPAHEVSTLRKQASKAAKHKVSGTV